MKLAPLVPAAVLLAALTACGGGGDSAAEPQAPAGIEDAVSSVTKAVEITEDNDPNNDIGRPGSYQAATVYYDSRTECDDPDVVNVSCGAKVEVFASQDQAEARMEYIQELTDASQGLLREYNYVNGTSLLRVSGDLKPSEASDYEAAFTG